MKRTSIRWILGFGVFVVLVWNIAARSAARDASSETVPVSMIVSVEARHGDQIPEIGREDVRAFVEKERVPVVAWTPFQGDRGGLDLLILVDDGIDSDVSMQFGALRQFMNNQPATTSIGMGYIRHGMVNLLQNFTQDHMAAGKALRIPLGAASESASAYLAISDFIDNWRPTGNRREIVLISDGEDLLEVGPMSVKKAVGRAQVADIQIYTMYAAGTGHAGHSAWRISRGQSNLEQIADETGGESYGLLPWAPVAYEPFLSALSDRLNHQYLLTFLAPQRYAGTFQPVHLETEVPNAELVGASEVYIPPEKFTGGIQP